MVISIENFFQDTNFDKEIQVFKNNEILYEGRT